MPTAKKLPSGNWRVRVLDYIDIDKYKHYKSITASTKKEAEYLASQYYYDKKQNRNQKSEDITLSAALNKYISSKSAVLSPSTIRSYQIMADNCYGEFLNCRLSDINEENAQAYFNKLTTKYKVKYLKNIYSLMSASMSFCKYEVPKITFPKQSKSEVKVPTLSEVKNIIKVLDKNPQIQCQILLAIMCSLRESEIYALTPEDIKGNEIHINKAYIRTQTGYAIKHTNKTYESTRVILMPDSLKLLVAERIKDLSPTERIFTGSPNTLLSSFKTLLKNNGIHPYTVHAMRHAFAALMHLNGVPDQYIMKLGGWKTAHVLKSVYQYAFDDETKRVNENANKFMENLTQK